MGFVIKMPRFPKIKFTDITHKQIDEIKCLKSEEILSEEAIKIMDYLINALKGVVKSARKLEGLIDAKKEDKEAIAQGLIELFSYMRVFESTGREISIPHLPGKDVLDTLWKYTTYMGYRGGGYKSNYYLEREKSDFIKMRELGERLAKLISATEKQEIAGRSYFPRKGKSEWNRIIQMEEKEKRQLRTNSHTLVAIMHNFLEGCEHAWEVRGRIYTIRSHVGVAFLHRHPSINEFLYDAYIKKELGKIREQLKCLKELALAMENSFNKVKQKLEEYERYTREIEQETRWTLNYEKRIGKEFEGIVA